MEEQIIFIFFLILSIIIHEVAHGMMALHLGDRTAEQAGRLTLNPLPHIDLLGSIILPAFLVMTGSPILFGWAKPVPFNPFNLRDKKWGEAKVALAGPAANIFIAIVTILIVWILNFFGYLNQNIFQLLGGLIFMNFFLAFFNLIPIFPLDGSKIFFSFLRDPKFINFKNFLVKNQMIIMLVVLFLIMRMNFITIFTNWVFNLFI